MICEETVAISPVWRATVRYKSVLQSTMSAKVAAKKYVTSSDEEDDAEYFEEDVGKWLNLIQFMSI